MFELLKSLAELMARPRLTTSELVAAVGRPHEDQEASLRVEPASASLSEAVVVREPGSDEPAYIRLELAEPPALDQMVSAFGPHEAPKLLPHGGDRRVIFRDVAVSGTHTATLIATVNDSDAVPALTIQRNPRLDG